MPARESSETPYVSHITSKGGSDHDEKYSSNLHFLLGKEEEAGV